MKEASFEQSNGNNNGNNCGTSGSCNNTVMKLKKWQATFDADHYIEASWNTYNTIHSIKLNVPLSEYLTATYVMAVVK